MRLFKESYLQSTVSGDDDSVIANRIITMGQKHKAKLSSKIQLEEEIQNRLKIYLGYTYRAISVESLLILESALLQFNRAEQRINHDYAGITMKLCKVFERELNILIFQSWKDKLLKSMTTVSLEDQLETAEINGDEIMRKLANWLLKRDKIDLGSMAYSIRRLIENCDNEMLQHFKEHISDLNNREFILSQNFLQICKLISTRYRNGGVYEKIVTYDICTEAFENILMNGKNYIKELADI